MRVPSEGTLRRVYGETERSRARFERLGGKFAEAYGEMETEFFTAPGRTEIVGNHTDHNGGRVLAASIDMDTIGAAAPSGDRIIEIISEGYRDRIRVDLDRLDRVPRGRGTLSLVAGIAAGTRKFGCRISGFRACVTSEVISSAGVSSSAAFEMLICSVIDFFFNDGKMGPVLYAKIGQYAENHYWDKASGLMDQMACAVGGTILLDFKRDVRFEKVDFSFEPLGYGMVIVNTGRGHADLSREYSEIPEEMRAVARALGGERLCDVTLADLCGHLTEVETKVKNDRAILRALHFLTEDARVEEMAACIPDRDGRRVLDILRESGRSSWELLQNCYPVSAFREQKVSLCLALTDLFLKQLGDGCCRVHGGGFAGVIMSIIPQDSVSDYADYIGQFVGREKVYPMRIRQTGAARLEQ